MDQLINMIRVATSSDATSEQKAAGVQACRTILTALDTEPGKPLAPPVSPSPAAGPTFDQMLGLLVARLTTIANARDAATDGAKQGPTSTRRVPPSSGGMRVPSAMAVPRTLVRPSNVARAAPATRPHTRKP